GNQCAACESPNSTTTRLPAGSPNRQSSGAAVGPKPAKQSRDVAWSSRAAAGDIRRTSGSGGRAAAEDSAEARGEGAAVAGEVPVPRGDDGGGSGTSGSVAAAGTDASGGVEELPGRTSTDTATVTATSTAPAGSA